MLGQKFHFANNNACININIYIYIYICLNLITHTYSYIYLIKLHAYMLIGFICISMQINYLASCRGNRQRKLLKVRGHFAKLK